jgi:hypothetical protein
VIAPSAERIVVGTVVEDLSGSEPVSDTGEYLPSAWFVLRVDEVLRGEAPPQLVIRRLASGVSLRKYPNCGGTALLSARVGDVIAIAYHGHRVGRSRSLTTAAWIEGTPLPDFMRDAQRLSLAQVRRAAAQLPATSGAAVGKPDDTLPGLALLATLAGATVVVTAASIKRLTGRALR